MAATFQKKSSVRRDRRQTEVLEALGRDRVVVRGGSALRARRESEKDQGRRK